ncbi:MAG TPA: beta-galactosidase, partial [Segetibacter sp.]
MKNVVLILSIILLSLQLRKTAGQTNTQKIDSENKIDLSGEWGFQTDPVDEGVQQEWFSKNLKERIKLPGSTATNGKGDDISVDTKWTGGIVDSSWFVKPEYAQYRQKGNIKVPFWLQPVKYYKGAAWYQKTVNIPPSWKQKHVELFIER